MPENIKIAAKDLNFYYGRFKALRDINLAIPTCQVTALIGPSGCGKSTFLRCLNRMDRALCIHGHFYQPPREDPWLGRILPEGSAAPSRHWNERICRESYAPLARARRLDGQGRIIDLVNCYEWMSFNVGPTLLSWMERSAPDTYARILEADRASAKRLGHGNALAQIYHHAQCAYENGSGKSSSPFASLCPGTHPGGNGTPVDRRRQFGQRGGPRPHPSEHHRRGGQGRHPVGRRHALDVSGHRRLRRPGHGEEAGHLADGLDEADLIGVEMGHLHGEVVDQRLPGLDAGRGGNGGDEQEKEQVGPARGAKRRPGESIFRPVRIRGVFHAPGRRRHLFPLFSLSDPPAEKGGCVGGQRALGSLKRRVSRRDGRAVEGGGLENHWRGNPSGGSNPSPSASLQATARCGQPFPVSSPSMAPLSDDFRGRRTPVT